jgi:hypothetical protein
MFNHTPAPQIYKDYLIVQESMGNDNYCALDLRHGGYIWCIEGSPFSNFAVDETQGTGYVLNENDQLLKIDLDSGKIIDSASFLPGVQKGNRGDSRYHYRHYLGAAKDHFIVLYFGDSKQLFGLSWQ